MPYYTLSVCVAQKITADKLYYSSNLTGKCTEQNGKLRSEAAKQEPLLRPTVAATHEYAKSPRQLCSLTERQEHPLPLWLLFHRPEPTNSSTGLIHLLYPQLDRTIERRDLRTLAPATRPRSPPDPRPPRRKRTSIACHPCRERRSACDGTRPTCASCGLRKLTCGYANQEDMEMRPTVLRSQNTALRERVAAYEAFVEFLRTIPQESMLDVVQRLRAGSGVTTLLDRLQRGQVVELISTPQEVIPASLSPQHEFGLPMLAFDLLGLAADLETSAAGGEANFYSHVDSFMAASLPFLPAAVDLSITQEAAFSIEDCQVVPGYNLSTTHQLSCDFLNEYTDTKRDSYNITASCHGFPVER